MEESEDRKIRQKSNSFWKKNKLRIFVLGVIIVVLGIVIYSLAKYNHDNQYFDYREVRFYVDEGYSYRTPIRVFYEDGKTGKVISEESYLYFVNDPRTLEDVGFYGEIGLEAQTAINISGELENCNEENIVSIQNLLNLYNIIGIKTVENENIGCDDLYGRYSWIGLKEGDKNEIIGWGLKGNCYNINVRNCEISRVVERFLLEILVRINKEEAEI